MKIFINYRRDDEGNTAFTIAQSLMREYGVENVFFDRQAIPPTTVFTKEIDKAFEDCLVFIPIIGKKWMHILNKRLSFNEKDHVLIEIEKAISKGVIIMPVLIDDASMPKENELPNNIRELTSINAVDISTDHRHLPKDLKLFISELNIIIDKDSNPASSEEKLDKTIHEKHLPIDSFRVTSWPEERAKYLTEYSHHFVKLGPHEKLRQKGAFSSFSIPDENIDNKIWEIRDHKSKYYHHLQREERKALEKHAINAGCRLIIDPNLELVGFPLVATLIRLETLLGFLINIKNKTNKNIEVAVSTSARESDVTIVGNRFSAIAHNLNSGRHTQTIFNCHAPQVLNDIKEFDMEFEEILKNGNIQSKDSINFATEEIKRTLSKIKYKIERIKK